MRPAVAEGTGAADRDWRRARRALVLAAGLAAALAPLGAAAQPTTSADPSMDAGPDGQPDGQPDGRLDASPDAGAEPDAGPATSPDAGAGPTVIDVPLDADAPAVASAAERGQAQLGAPFTLFVTATARAGVAVAMQDPVDLGPAFEVRRKLASSQRRSDGSQTFEWQLEVVAWEVGDLRLPPIALVFEAHGRKGLVRTPAAPIRITGTLDEADDGSKPRGLAPPRALAGAMQRWWWLAGGALTLLLLGGAWWWLRRPLPTASAGPRGRWLPRRELPAERALRRLAELERTHALLRQQKTGYAELADVIRELTGELGRFATGDLTSAELGRAMARYPSVAGAATEVLGWLERIDKVKYAAYTASAVEAATALDDARALVQRLAETAGPGHAPTALPAAERGDQAPASDPAAPSAPAEAAAPEHRAPPPQEAP